VLDRPPLAGAPYARLHLVGDEQDAVPVAQLAQAREKVRRRYDVAAFALDRLDQDRGDLFGRQRPGKQNVLDIVHDGVPGILARLHDEQRTVRVGERDMPHAGHRREKALLLREPAGGERQAAHRATMKAAQKADKALPPGRIACELDRRFDGFRARVGVKDAHLFTHRRDRVDLFTQRHHRVVIIVGRDVDEFLDLLLDGPDDLGMRMAGRKDRDAGGKVNVAIAIHVPTFGALAVIHDKRVIARVGWRRMFFVSNENRLGLGAWHIVFLDSHWGSPVLSSVFRIAYSVSMTEYAID